MGVRTTSRNAAPGNGPTPWYDGHLDKFYNTEFNEGDTGTNYTPPPEYQGHSASGGVIHDYVDSGVAYRCHIFSSDSSFDVTTLSAYYPADVDYLLIGGGGGGGCDLGPGYAGGGGAGAVRATVGTNGGGQSLDAKYTIAASTNYPIQIGGGGQAANYNQSDTTMGGIHTPGGNSSIFGLTAYGGGRGGNNQQDGAIHPSGPTNAGSGGGAGYNAESGASGPYGYPGGGYPGNAADGAGGGGAGSAGGVPPGQVRGGGQGVQATIVGPPALARGIVGTANNTPNNPAPATTYGWVGGGGDTSGDAYGVGGGGKYSQAQDSNPTFGNVTLGIWGTGGGAGGAGSGWAGGQGGSGLCVVRYQIGVTLMNTAKATGGAVSFYDAPDGNTYCNHAFLHSGIFTNESGSPLAIDHVIIAGGGGGGFERGGGGGAGGIRTNIPGMMPAADAQQTVGAGSPNAITVTVGGGGKGGRMDPIYSQAWGGDDSGINGPGPISLWAAGGGWGASGPGPTTKPSSDGGSGGGGVSSPTLAGSPGNEFHPYSPRNPSPAANQGHGGGNANTGSPHYGSGGGGGAGGEGQNGSPSAGGAGGVGVQLPLQFRNPDAVFGGIGPGPGSAPGPGPGQFWVGGGGGGGYYDSSGSPWVGGPGGGGGPNSGKLGYSGGGPASPGNTMPGGRGAPGTGGGGGAGMRNPAPHKEDGGMGGSGLVLISYTI